MSTQNLSEFLQSPSNARLEDHATLDRVEIADDLGIESGAFEFKLMLSVDGLHRLLRGERDQHTDYDNPHLASEVAPAVERFG